MEDGTNIPIYTNNFKKAHIIPLLIFDKGYSVATANLLNVIGAFIYEHILGKEINQMADEIN